MSTKSPEPGTSAVEEGSEALFAASLSFFFHLCYFSHVLIRAVILDPVLLYPDFLSVLVESGDP